jgi:hypothetical protein
MKKPELGTPITKYIIKDLRWRDLLRVFLPFLLVVLTPIAYGFWRTLYGFSSFGPAAAASWGRTWFLIGGVLVLFLLFYSLNRLKKAHTWIEMYRWGLFFHFPLGRKKILNWEDIFGLTSYSVTKSFFGLGKKTDQNLILHSRRFKPILCNPRLERIEGLKKNIKKQVYARVQPAFVQAFSTGEIIPFGEVSLSKRSLFLPKQEIPWEFLKGISVQKGIFIIKLTDQNQLEVPIRKIQNLEILVHLLKTEI